MPFKVRELMIHVLPQEGSGGNCGASTQMAFGCGYTWWTHPPLQWYPPWPWTHPPLVSPGDRLSALTTLKQQLRDQLADIEALEKVAQERLRPQTLSEIEDLIKKVKEALEELEKSKKELEQKPPQG